jgi:fatty acid desaturase
MMILESALPQVLPSERLLTSGKAIPAVRAELRHINDARNALTVSSLWFWVIVLAGLQRFVGWWAWFPAFVLMTPMHVRFNILMHEAAHKLLFNNKRVNDFVGQWIVAYPAFSPIGVYRRAHFAHHREEFGPEEPDIPFYAGYRTTTEVLRRRLIRDAFGNSGWKNLKPILRGLKSASSRPVAGRILLMQLPMFAIVWAASGQWYAYIVLWLAPWMTGWRFINRLRAIAEHGGLGASADRRRTTHDVHQSLLARFWMVPFNTGWHLAHHVDMGIPWRNLPAFHRELVAAGYVVSEITYPTYRSLWRALTSEGQPASFRPVPTAA